MSLGWSRNFLIFTLFVALVASRHAQDSTNNHALNPLRAPEASKQHAGVTLSALMTQELLAKSGTFIPSPCAIYINNQCSNCGKGSFLNSTSGCELCPPGTYQDQDYYSENFCMGCPTNTRCLNAQCETSYSSAMYPGAPNKNACSYPLLLNSRATWITAAIAGGVWIGALLVLYFIPKYYEEFLLHSKWWGIVCTLVLYIVNDIAKYYWVIGLHKSDYSIVLNHFVQNLDYILISLAGVLFLVFLYSFAQILNVITLFIILICELGHFGINLWLLVSGVSTEPLYFYDDANQRTSDGPITILPITQYREIDTILVCIIAALSVLHTFLALAAARIKAISENPSTRDLIK